MNGRITRDGEYVVIRIPLEDVHSLRVAMHPCPCKAVKSNSTKDIRASLERGLARALTGKR